MTVGALGVGESMILLMELWESKSCWFGMDIIAAPEDGGEIGQHLEAKAMDLLRCPLHALTLAAVLAVGSTSWLGVLASAANSVELEDPPERVSIGDQGNQATQPTFTGRVSDTGRYVAFATRANNLVAQDHGRNDVFVRDRTEAVTTRVSVSSAGVPANQDSEVSDISADGRYVLFESRASNLVPDDTNGVADLFVHDSVRGATRRITLASDGQQANSPSWDGTFSGNGKWVAFVSLATNLVSRATAPELTHVYIHNLATGRTTLVSRSRDGTVANAASFGPSLSANGRYVAFESMATNLGNPVVTKPRSKVFVLDRRTGKTRLVSLNPNGSPLRKDSQMAEISRDGSVVAWVAGRYDRSGPLYSTYAWDRDTGTSELVSVFQSGEESFLRSRGQLAVSGDGRLILFSSRDELDGDASGQTDPFANDSDVFVFVRDREANTTTRIAHTQVTDDPFAGPIASMAMDITPDGRYTLFVSTADRLVPNDMNREYDLFIQDVAASD